MAPIDNVLNALRETTEQEPLQAGNGWKCLCPAHDDHNPSLSVSEGDGGRVLVKCMSQGCDFESIAAALGLKTSDFFADDGSMMPRDSHRSSFDNPPRSTDSKRAFESCRAAIAFLETKLGKRSAAWNYRDASGKHVGSVVRWDGSGCNNSDKTFRQIALTANGWECRAMPEPRPLYRLDGLLRSDGSKFVFVVEGEKCADSADALGLLTVTSAGGSNAAAKTDWKPLAGRSVVIIPDKDEPGRKYARQVAGILTKLDPPATVKLIDLANDWPELPDAGDLADWCDAHEDIEAETLRQRLDALIGRATNWTPATVATEDRERQSRTTLKLRFCLQSFAEVERKELRWLWPNRFPLGMLSLVSGNPAAGKSMLMADFIARVTTGAAWPDDGNDSPQRTPGDVILLNAEDSVSRCQKPRLEAAGADVGRVHYIKPKTRMFADDGDGDESHRDVVEARSFNLMNSASLLRELSRDLPELRLIVLDPLAAFLADIRANDQGEIRAALSPLVALAEKLDVAIVFVHHNRKGTGSHSSERLSGSLQIGATMRQIWEVTRDPDDKERRLFVSGKNSNARDRGGLAFHVVDSTVPQSSEGSFVGRVQWDAGLLDITADDVASNELDEESCDSFPVEWLRDALAGGARSVKEVTDSARALQITQKQLRTARKRLGVTSQKSGESFHAGWVWSLPQERRAA